jgi:hypothetical protein
MTKIDDTILLLSRDVETRPQTLPLKQFYRLMLTSGILLIIGLTMIAAFLGWMELRPDYEVFFYQPEVMLKQVLPLMAILVLLPGFSYVCHPETEMRLLRLMMALVIISILPMMVIFHLFLHPAHDWAALIQGGSMTRCILLIPMLAVVVLSAQILVLRRGAPSQPIMAGTQAGIIAGAIATIVYANFCTEDNPMFYGIWYALGMIISMIIGALAGWRLLRW